MEGKGNYVLSTKENWYNGKDRGAGEGMVSSSSLGFGEGVDDFNHRTYQLKGWNNARTA